MDLPVPALHPAFQIRARIDAPQDYGPTRAGHRRVVPILGGEASGEIEGEILPGGADWQLILPDGSFEVDCRYSARTTSGSLVYLQVKGVRTGEPAVLERLARGEDVAPEEYYFRTAIHLETSAPELRHLERAIYVASCARQVDEVRYTAYRVS